ncbi:glycerol kinase [Gemmatimonadetes bacterium T265]|nr:glycerol kinase [Gemmatimonadetes bacterium T265]
MSEGVVLAIDQGTTGTTVLVFDHDAAVRGRAYAEVTQHYPQPGWVEHDADEIWRGARRLVGAALADAAVRPADVHAVGITNQRETTVLWDRATGEPVHRAIVWQDRRTAPACERLRADGLEPEVRRRTGLVLDPYFSATKLRWLFDTVPGLRARAERGELAFGTVDAWLLWQLSGGTAAAGAVHATDVTNASRTLLFNIEELRWDPTLLAAFGIPEAVLPRVLPSAAVRARTSPDAFLGAAVPIAGVAGDQHAALFGQACFREGMVKNTYGTGAFLMMHAGARPVPSETGLLTTLAWQLEGEPAEYALEGAIFVAGAAVQWLRDGLGVIASAADTEALAVSIASNEGVYFVPALTGLGAPHWDPYARGTLVGLTRGSTRAHLARAALESMAYQTADVVGAMARDTGLTLQAGRPLRADGGAAVNAFLMQFQADVLGVPVEVPRVTETTALGAAYLAGLATGFWRDRDELARRWQLARRYEPRMGPAERDHLTGDWLRAVERAKGWARPTA